jgi:hypothetical protein
MSPWVMLLFAAPEMVELQVSPSVDLTCDERRVCQAMVVVTVRNPTAEAATLHSIEARGETLLALKSVEPPGVTLAPGASWSTTLPLSRAGQWWLSLDVSLGEREWKNAPRAKVVVRDRVVERERAECRACRGDWGPHGLVGLEGCICRAKDAGKVCRDGRDCEGECVFQRAEVVRKERRQCNAQGVCTVSPALGRAVGKCSEKIGDFGCASLIDVGASDLPPQSLPLQRSQICRD